MGWPCPSLSLGTSWSQWMPALEISQRNECLPKWMQKWNNTWKVEYQIGEPGEIWWQSSHPHVYDMGIEIIYSIFQCSITHITPVCFLNRSIVLMATRGQPEDLVDVAPYLVTVFGMAKPADLHSKGQWCIYLLSRYYLFRHCLFCSYTLIAASYHRESGTLGVLQNQQQGLFISSLGLSKSWSGGWLPGAAGAIPPPWFGDIWLYPNCS